MIVIAIIGILAAVALPQYHDYVIRTESSNSLASVRPIQLEVSEYTARYAALPAACANLATYSGVSCTATDHALGSVAAISIGANGVLEVLMDTAASGVPAEIADTTYLLTPTSNTNGSIDWLIGVGGSNAMEAKFIPRR